jgi:hypothetical protein
MVTSGNFFIYEMRSVVFAPCDLFRNRTRDHLHILNSFPYKSDLRIAPECACHAANILIKMKNRKLPVLFSID